MAVAGQKNSKAEEVNASRDDLEQKLAGVSFGFGVSRHDFVRALERFIDANINWKLDGRY